VLIIHLLHDYVYLKKIIRCIIKKKYNTIKTGPG
jgi:hypothetical protein